MSLSFLSCQKVRKYSKINGLCQQDTGPPEVVKAGMLLAINKKKLDYNPKFKINIHRDK